MYFNFVILTLLFLCYLLVHNVGQAFADPSESDVLQAMEVGAANLLAAKDVDTGCVTIDGLCLQESDLSSYEAIRSLHRLLDDDMSGEIDMTESVDFLMEELTITDGYNSRQKNLHHNSDSYISVQDLWHMWKRSEVHNWTVEQTVQWLTDVVGLPQYSEAFVAHAINGSYLPRLTMNKSNYLGSVLGIKGLSHRTKVTVKAMDAVLFGPPKGSHLKDMLIAGLVTVILLGLGYIILRNHKMRGYHTKLIMQIEDLQQEEVKYRQHLQKIKEKERDDSKVGQKQAPVSSEVPDSGVGGDVGSVSDVSSNNDEDGATSLPASRAGGEDYSVNDYDSNAGSVTPPNDYAAHLDRASLEHWLQVTYQKEKAVVDFKRKQAQGQIVKATEICNKLRAQGKNPLNLFSLMHGKMDNVEKTISLARAGMHEVQRDEKERLERWGEIERLLDCNIRQLADLHNVMGSYTSLQTNATNPADSPNIEHSSSTTTTAAAGASSNSGTVKSSGGGGSVRSTTSSTRSTNGGTSLHQSVTVATEMQRLDDNVDSVSLPRSSSVGSSSVRLPSSASHQQLSSECSDSTTYSSSRLPPQKRPRRNRPSSVITKPNGLVLAEQAVGSNNTGSGASTPCDANTTGFTMGGSPLVLPADSSLLQQQQQHAPDADTTGDAVAAPAHPTHQSRGVANSVSDPLLSAASPAHDTGSASHSTTELPSLSTTSASPTAASPAPARSTPSPAPSNHRPLSQVSLDDGNGLTPSSLRRKKKSFFERFTGSRKSTSKSSKT